MRFLTVWLVAGATLVAKAIITSPVSSAGFATSIAADGWFLTGRDIEAGTYRTPGPISQYIKCSWTTHKYLNNSDFRIRSYTASAGPYSRRYHEGIAMSGTPWKRKAAKHGWWCRK